MKDWFHVNGLKTKEIKIFIALLGGGYAGYGSINAFSLWFQQKMFDSFPSDDSLFSTDSSISPFLETMMQMSDVMQTFMPLLVLLGLSYLLLAAFLEKVGDFGFGLSIILAVLSIAWVVGYAISSAGYLNSFSEFGGETFPGFGKFAMIAGVSGFVQFIGIFVVPQILIIRWVSKNIRQHQPAS